MIGCIIGAILAGSVLVATAQGTDYSGTPDWTDGVDGEVFAMEIIGDQVWIGGDFMLTSDFMSAP